MWFTITVENKFAIAVEKNKQTLNQRGLAVIGPNIHGLWVGRSREDLHVRYVLQGKQLACG